MVDQTHRENLVRKTFMVNHSHLMISVQLVQSHFSYGIENNWESNSDKIKRGTHACSETQWLPEDTSDALQLYFLTTCSPYVRESTKVLDYGSQHLDFGFQPFGFRIPTFWIPDSIPKWIPDSKRLWIPDSSLWIPDSNSKNLLDSGFRILLHGANLYSFVPPWNPKMTSNVSHHR